MHLAAMLGHRFTILTVLDQLMHVDEAKAAGYGLTGRLASVRSGLSQSKRTYPGPPAKHRPGYAALLGPSPAGTG
jgi:hypothetical protein